MVEFIDKIQDEPNKIKLTAVEGEENTYIYEKTGTITQQGTNLNRGNLMAVQGFEQLTTTFNNDGSITQTNGSNQTLTIEFGTTGITETFVGSKTMKKTTKLSNGSLQEVLS